MVSLDAVPGDDSAGALADPAAGSDEIVLAAIEAAEVRAAVERLPEGERCVVALHHLAEMPYAEVAAFLGISVAAAKKRAWSARARLKELVPMVADALAAARPSSSEAFRDTVLLFQALRVHDADALARLLARNPTLSTATEDWAPVEGFESRLGFSERATALIRAAGTGDLRLVRLLVEAGAPVADLCGCAGHESALVAAVNIGATEVVQYLLDQGASPDGGRSTGNPLPCTSPCTESGTISCRGCSPREPLQRRTSTGAPPRTGQRSGPDADQRRTTVPSSGHGSGPSISSLPCGEGRWCTSHPPMDSAPCAPCSAWSTRSRRLTGG